MDEISVKNDLLQMISGTFTSRSVGEEAFNAVRERIRSDPLPYLQELEALFVQPEDSATLLADSLIARVLELTRERAPQRTEELRNRLLQKLDGLLPKESVGEATEDGLYTQAWRLNRQREALRSITSEAPK